MDWLSDESLSLTYSMGIECVKQLETKGANSLPFDYEDALSRMLVNLQTDLKGIAYHKMTKTAKSNEESSKLRAAGNKWFTSTEHDSLDRALEFYTKSIAFALPNSEELAFGYANRSAVFLKMNCPQECLNNIERALLNYPENLLSKLYDRQAQCYSQLAEECMMEAKVWLDKVPVKDLNRAGLEAILNDCPEKKLQNFVIYNDCVVPEIKNPSKRYSCASDAVEVQYSQQFGRHVVATRDIDVGEVLIVERPYLRFLNQDNLYSHCSFCKTFLWDGIPCDECVSTVYCSVSCERKAWVEYHQMECTVSDLIMKYDDFGISDKTECIRLLLQMHHEAGGLQQLKERVINILGSTLDACTMEVQDHWYQGTTLESILCLISHEDKTTRTEFEEVVIRTLRIMFYLLTSTDFFGVQFNRNETYDLDVISFMAKNSDFIFVGKLLTKLFNIIRRNSYGSNELTETGPKTLGTITTGLLSLLNNNCYQNTFLIFTKDHLVAYAVYPIKKGEQIFTCYCGSYARVDKPARQKNYEECFFFTCNCIACTDNWSMDIHNVDNVKYGLNIERLWQRHKSGHKDLCMMASNVFSSGHYRDLDELLTSFHRVIGAIYKEIGVNSMEMRFILPSLHQAYLLTGNVRKYRKLSDALR